MHAPRFAAAAILALALAGPASLSPPAAAIDDAVGIAKYDVVYIPTPEEVVERMLEMAEVGPDDFLIDLGSGDGRIPITAAAKYGTRGLGVDLDVPLVEYARKRAALAGVADKVEFREQNLFDTDISQATVLTLYLLPELNLRLRPVILDTMKPGTRVVSHQFDMDDWRPDARADIEWRHVFLWIVPARVEGRWRVETADGAFEISLAQRYQKVSGKAVIDGRETPLAEVGLRGAEIRFVVERGEAGRQSFVGTVADGVIEGVAAPGTVPGWRAAKL